ncbi:MAG: undecaprenyl-diphosphate phosphatase [Polynucleobacter sp.]|jgi:undecaprenyl-diphosphatase
MDFIFLIKAVILGVVEGLTEFLPISSTGHLILVGDLLHFNDGHGKAFEIIIQFGAILAVCWEYRQKLGQVVMSLGSRASSRRFILNLVIATIPAAVLGILFGKYIKSYLFAPIPVALAFIGGALVIFWAEKRQVQYGAQQKLNRPIHSVDDLSAFDALKVGMVQCAALIPGTSRSGATIIGGMLLGLPRTVATEFSFFLAIPVIGGATIYELLKLSKAPATVLLVSPADFTLALILGFVAAFIAAFICVRWLIHYVASHTFIPFAWYRIIFGAFILITSYTGFIAWTQ